MRFVQHCRQRLIRWRDLAVGLFFQQFFVLLLAVISLAQWACVAWLASALDHPFSLAAQGIGAVAVYAGNRRLIRSIRRPRNGGGWRPVLLRGYSAFAFTSLFCAAFLALDAIAWGMLRITLGSLVVEAGTLQPVSAGSLIDRLFQWSSVAGISTIAVAFTYGYSFGQRRLTVTHLQLPLAYPAGLHGLRIAQISDIHIGQNLTAAQLRRFVGRVNALDPDLVCITGDIADGPAADLPGQLPILATLRARYGVYAVLGNHDHYAGADRVEAALRRYTPFTVLRDAIATVEIRGTRLHVAGVDDIGRDWARGVHQHAGLAQLEARLPTSEPVLLLTHRPETFTHSAALRIPLTLAGHTHGGQVALPWIDGRPRGLARFVTPFDGGLFEQDGCYLYVNRGLGVTGQRIRLFAPREISIIEVVATAERAAA